MKVAIIGSGISGLGSAAILHPHADITLYEKNARLGGHSRTVTIDVDEKPISVDTGFIVFNHRNYPHLTAMFKHYGVETSLSDMSFGARIEALNLEYGTPSPSKLFAQKRNLFRPKFWRMLRDILRFNQQAKNALQKHPNITLQKLLEKLGLGEWFCNYYLLAMGAAIWSTPLAKMLDFPAKTFVTFFDNHGLLTVNDQPQWHTVTGGSQNYIKKVSTHFQDKIRYESDVIAVERLGEQGVRVKTATDEAIFDHVIFACHSDEALALLKTPSPLEKQLLSAIRYQDNKMVLHCDTRFMPQRKSAWSSWIYLSEQAKDNAQTVSLTYWMNNLQPLQTETPILVTLNPNEENLPKNILDTYTFRHPIFDQAAIAAQGAFDAIQGLDKISYAGAWLRYGFHEDGLLSAVNVTQKMGFETPWKLEK